MDFNESFKICQHRHKEQMIKKYLDADGYPYHYQNLKDFLSLHS